jgi:hypothetical protein
MRFTNMRFTKKKSAAALSALVLGVGAGVVGVTATSSSASTPTGGRDCVSFTAKEVSHLDIHDVAAPGGGPGDSVVYHNEMLDANGTQFGFVDGTALVYTSPVDGQLSEALAANAVLPQGTVFATAHISVISAAKGEWQTMAAVGTTGSLRGKVGVWKFSLVEQPSPTLTIFKSEGKLCG